MSTLMDSTAPTLVSASVNGALLTLTYSEPLESNASPPSTAFTLTVNGLTREIASVQVTGSTVTLTLDSAVERYQVVALGYDPSQAVTPTQDLAGHSADPFNGQAVANVTIGSPNFNLLGTNPYHLIDIGTTARPTFVDIDGDGDLDAFFGSSAAGLKFFRNVGSATAPDFSAAAIANPFGLGNQLYSTPTFVDINGDGLLDALVGIVNGGTMVYLNTGSASLPAFTLVGPNAFGLTSVQNYAKIAAADLDGDGDIDLLIGDNNGLTTYFRNDGTATAPSFTSMGASALGIGDVGFVSTPALVDLDNDGDLDLLIGTYAGDTVVYRNDGTTTSPNFTLVGSNLYGLGNVGAAALPVLADINGDGLVDVLIGNNAGNTVVYLQGPPPPAAPTDLALSPASNSGSTDDLLTKATTLVITGRAVPLSTVTVFDGAQPVGTTTAQADGSWQITTTSLNEGVRTLTATATSAYHTGTSAASTALLVTIDATAPQAPVITSAALTEQPNPTISGTAEAGAAITLTVGGATYTTLATNGVWSVDLSAPPASGTLTLNVRGDNGVSVTATDPAGNVSSAGQQTLVIDAGPNAPVITSTDLTNLATPIIAGTADVDATITVTIGGAVYTTVATDGTWHVDLSLPPASGTLTLNTNGTNTVSVTATDSASNVSDPDTQALVIDTVAPSVPVLTSAALTNAVAPIIEGAAEVGAAVEVTVGGAVYATVAVNGTWQVDLSLPPSSGTLQLNANGSNPVSVTATDPAGNVSAAAEQTLVIDTTAPGVPVFTSAALTNMAIPVIEGTAEVGAVVEVTVGGAVYATVATDGTWQVDLSLPPSSGTLQLNTNGSNPVSVTATDPASNVSLAGEQTLVIDTTAPSVPVLTSAALTNAAAPVIEGTAEVGASVEVTVGGAVYAAVAVNGTWQVDLSLPPSSGTLQLNTNGSNPVSVTATDPAGNVSLAAEQTLVIDTTAPGLPVLTSAALTNVATPVVEGTAEVGAAVEVTVGGAVYTTVATDGTWQVDLSLPPSSGTLQLNTNGNNAVSVTATDPAGNTSLAAAQTLVIDTTAPDIPVLTSAALTNAAAPVIEGTAEVGASVEVTVGGAVYATVAVNGTWQVDLALPPSSGTLQLNTNGSNAVSVTATDPAGNTSLAAAQTLVIDTTAPGVPVLTSAALTNAVAPIIEGTAEVGAAVEVTVGGAVYATVATDGTWQVDLALSPSSGTLQLNANGSNPVSVTATDPAGNVSLAAEQTLVIDTTAPGVPVITSAALTNAAAPVVEGTAEVGASVEVTVGGAVYATVAINGTWQVDLSLPPASGTLQLNANGGNPVSVTATDPAGNVSLAGEQTLVIDTTAPGLPLLTSAALTNVANPVIEGTAEIGAVVEVTVGGAVYATVATHGTWQVDLSLPPASGTLQLNANGSNPVSVTATDPAGNVSLAAEQTLVIDTTAPGVPVLTSPTLTNATAPVIEGTAEVGASVEVTVGGAVYAAVVVNGTWQVDLSLPPSSGTLQLNTNGSNPVSVTATDLAGNVSLAAEQTLVIDTTAPGVPVLTSTALTNAVAPIIQGTAEVGAAVEVTVGGAVYATVATDGTWQVDLSQPPSSGTLQLNTNGSNPVSVTATDPAGNVSLAGEQTLVIDTTAPGVPVLTSAALTNVPAPVIEGTAEVGASVEVTVGGAVYATVATDGTWQVDLSQPPSSGTLQLSTNGSNPVSVTATDPAGNVSLAGEQTLVIDTTAPGLPVLTSATLTNAVAPIIEGTAEVGAVVEVTVGGALYATVAVNGTWQVDLSLPPSSGALQLNTNGSNPVSVTATDLAGNVSLAAAQTLVIDTTAPDIPVLTSAALTNAAAPVIEGTAEVGASVEVTVGGAVYATVAVDGTWQVDLSLPPASGTLQLNANGSNPVSVTATDPAGNVSPAAEQTLVIDTTAPGLPVLTSAALTNAVTPIIEGTAEVGSIVEVTIGGAVYTTVASDGTWRVDLSLPPSSGTLQLNTHGGNPVSVIATDPAGNMSLAGEQTLVIDTTGPAAPTGVTLPAGGPTNIDMVTIDLAALENGATWQYSVDAGQTWIEGGPDGAFILAEGEYAAGAIQVRQVDAAGNLGTPLSTAADAVIDTAAPVAPSVGSGTLTASRTPVVNGTAEDGSTVTVSVGGATFTTLAQNGRWQVNLGSEPATGVLTLNLNGANTIVVTATDPAGNVSSSSEQSLVIDTTAPSAPTLDFTATASTWVVSVANLEAGANWQYQIAGGDWISGQGNGLTVPMGDYPAGALLVRQVDAAGNVGPVAGNAALARPITDSDGDGLDDDIENGVPGLGGGQRGDGNGDGIPDVEQADVTSLPWVQTPDGQVRYVTLVNDAGLVQRATSTAPIDATTLPATLTLPLGALAFTVRDLPESGVVTFSVFVDADVPVNGYWKQVEGHWINIATAIEAVGGKVRIDFQIEDGGRFDADGQRNGVIVDPGAPGWLDGNPQDADGDQVPDLLEWDLGLTPGLRDNDVFARNDLFVMQVYRDALGREADAGGLGYWQQQLDDGMTREAFLDHVLTSEEAMAVEPLARLAVSLLERAPEQAEWAMWREGLAQGQSTAALVDAFVLAHDGQSTDAAFIDQLYAHALSRDADAAGRTYWLGALAEGSSRGAIALQFAQSEEALQMQGQAVAVTLLYEGLLARGIDAAGLAYWGQALAGGASLGEVAIAIVGSAEYHDRFLPGQDGDVPG